ncbi:hypothetical protein FACS1894191_6340 [Clostridia bacterium]|nr:hypothetical protein FACS1894191_6340 [Clostridia bacterium]
MHMQRASREAMPRLAQLWKECFGDTEEFTGLIFARLIKPEQAFVSTEDGAIPAMMFYQPFKLKTHEGACKGAYIYGVATDPAYRGRGYSTGLLEYANGRLSREGYALSVLVPADGGLFDFYAKRGYGVFSQLRHVAVNAGDIAAGAELSASPVRLEDMRSLREAHFTPSSGFVSWDEDYLRFTGDECIHSGGGIYLLEGTGARGYAVCYPEEGAVCVKELVLTPPLFDAAASAIHRIYGAEKYIFRLREDFAMENVGALLPYSMVKWYDRSGAPEESPPPPYIAFTVD